jgi:predicted membrane GTPase involved in stress response
MLTGGSASSFHEAEPPVGITRRSLVTREQLTNHRASGGEELVQLQTPVDMSLERALEYIGSDELLEVTPESIRLRKMSKKLAKR